MAFELETFQGVKTHLQTRITPFHTGLSEHLFATPPQMRLTPPLGGGISILDPTSGVFFEKIPIFRDLRVLLAKAYFSPPFFFTPPPTLGWGVRGVLIAHNTSRILRSYPLVYGYFSLSLSISLSVSLSFSISRTFNRMLYVRRIELELCVPFVCPRDQAPP